MSDKLKFDDELTFTSLVKVMRAIRPDAVDAFVANATAKGPRMPTSHVSVLGAFVWSESPEGMDYWYEVSEECKEYMRTWFK